MKKYSVLMYATVMVRPKEPVEAESPTEAADKVVNEHFIDLHRLFNINGGRGPFSLVEFGDEVHGFLVDEVGDENYEHTVYLDSDGTPEDDTEEVRAIEGMCRESERLGIPRPELIKMFAEGRCELVKKPV